MASAYSETRAVRCSRCLPGPTSSPIPRSSFSFLYASTCGHFDFFFLNFMRLGYWRSIRNLGFAWNGTFDVVSNAELGFHIFSKVVFERECNLCSD